MGLFWGGWEDAVKKSGEKVNEVGSCFLSLPMPQIFVFLAFCENKISLILLFTWVNHDLKVLK